MCEAIQVNSGKHFFAQEAPFCILYYLMDVISPFGDPSAQPRWALDRPVTFERDAFIGRFQNRLAPSVGQYRFHQVPSGSARSVCFSVAVVGK